MAVLVALGACGAPDEVDEARPGDESPIWQALPDALLSPRTNSVAAWTGTEALFLGGETGGFCPPTANCEGGPVLVKDGAAYPATRTWRRVAEAPIALSGPMPPAVIGDTVFLIQDRRLLAYDAGEDDWTHHGRVPKAAAYGSPVATGDGRLVLGGGAHGPGDPPDRLYDPRAKVWSDLPLDPIGAGSERWYTATPAGLVATGAPYEPNQTGPALVRAAVFDLDARTWRLLPISEQVGGYRWTWTGTRMVSPFLGGADGGEVNNWGRWYPDGGTLDPAAGVWAPLSKAPKNPSSGWRAYALGSRWSANAGWIYDDAVGSWTRLPVPDGAPYSATDPYSAGSAVWAGDTLLSFGGGDGLATKDERLTAGAWVYTVSATTHD